MLKKNQTPSLGKMCKIKSLIMYWPDIEGVSSRQKLSVDMPSQCNRHRLESSAMRSHTTLIYTRRPTNSTYKHPNVLLLGTHRIRFVRFQTEPGLFFSITSTLLAGPTKLSIQQVPRGWSGKTTNLSRGEVYNMWSSASILPTRLNGMVLMQSFRRVKCKWALWWRE